ncbi:MAG: sigma factor-like helix-turn-helix DNA-binding protein [Chromatiaceae bacterium]|jgi:DNA-directed RNA polymerase specialized sigma24 family protein
MLRFYRELSLEDIARTLGIGLSAAKMRLYRALAQFEAAFETSGAAEVA